MITYQLSNLNIIQTKCLSETSNLVSIDFFHQNADDSQHFEQISKTVRYIEVILRRYGIQRTPVHIK